MKIGIVSTWFERGAAYVSMQFMDILQNLGHEVFIYARGGEEFAKNDRKWNLDNVTWNSFLYSPVPTDIDRVQYEEWLENNDIEAVIFNEQQYWQPVIWTKNKNVRTIAYIDYYTKDTVPLFELYDQLWCNTERHYSVFKWHSNAVYIPWGTDINLFSRQLKNITRPVTFFHSSGLNPFRKGTDLVLKATLQILKKGKINFNLVIHSQVELERFFPELKPSILELKKSGVLEVITKTVAAPGLYHLGDVYIYPSRLEGIGLTIAEALACGLPVITSNEAPMSEFVDENFCRLVNIREREVRTDGYYWPMSHVDIDDLDLAMCEYIDNIDDIEEFKQLARFHAEDKLDFSKNILVVQKALLEINGENNNISTVINNANCYDRTHSVFYKSVPKLYRITYGIAKKIKRKIL